MKALVVVDYQADFVNGALGFAGAELLEPVILKKIEKCRAEGGQVIFTLDTHSENYLETAEGKKLPVVHCVDGTAGHRLYGRIAECAAECDIVIKKPAFGSLELADLLKKCGFDEVELCGLVTDICVVSNAMLLKAAMPEISIRVDPLCCAGVTPKSHQAALLTMEMCQIEIE